MLMLGIHSYSYHLHMEDLDSPKGVNWFISRTISHGLNACHIDSRHLCAWNEDIVRNIGKEAAENSLFLSLGTGGYDFDRLSSRLLLAAEVGAKMVVTFIGGDRSKVRQEQRKEEISRAVESYKRLADVAERAEIVLAIENHGDLTSNEICSIISNVNSPFVRACLNPGNALCVWEDSVECTRNLLSYASAVHLRDFVREWKDGVVIRRGCVLGEGDAHMAEIIPMLKAYPGLPVILDIPSTVPDQLVCDKRKEEAIVAASIHYVRQQMLI